MNALLRVGILTMLAMVAGLSASPVTGSQERARAAGSNDALVIYSAGLDQLLCDAKDQGLLQALRMAGDRVLELPGELGDQVPAAALQLLIEAAARPMTLRAGMLDAPRESALPVYAQIGLAASSHQQAKALLERFLVLLRSMAPVTTEPHPTLSDVYTLDLDGAPGFAGVTGADGQAAFFLALNRMVDAPLDLEGLGLPGDVRPKLALRLDLKRIQPLLEMILGRAGPAASMIRSTWESLGLMGPAPLAFTFAMGDGPDRAHAVFRIANYLGVLQGLGLAPEGALQADDLRMIPADATYAVIGKANLKALPRTVERIVRQSGGLPTAGAAGGGPDSPSPFDSMIERVVDRLGIHPVHDFFDYLGQLFGVYMAETTGGGGPLSAVAFVEVTDGEAVSRTLSRVVGLANQAGASAADGYFRIRKTLLRGQEVFLVTFPGLPIPFEPSFAVVNGFMFIAASPGGLLAAIDQSRDGVTCLTDNAGFLAMGGDGYRGALQVRYSDTPRSIRSGYSWVQLATTALANAVRSPTDAERGPGVIMPSYKALLSGAKASVTIVKLEGDDLVGRSQFDRSFLVNACSLSADPGTMVALTSLGASLFVARSSTQSVAAELDQAISHLPDWVLRPGGVYADESGVAALFAVGAADPSPSVVAQRTWALENGRRELAGVLAVHVQSTITTWARDVADRYGLEGVAAAVRDSEPVARAVSQATVLGAQPINTTQDPATGVLYLQMRMPLDAGFVERYVSVVRAAMADLLADQPEETRQAALSDLDKAVEKSVREMRSQAVPSSGG